ncbi:helix-turn-helix domain-containing protein [Rhizobium sp. A37_96]
MRNISEGAAQPKTDQDFGVRVKDLRSARKWTLERLADMSGVSISALSKIENGQVSASFDTIVKIAHAFGLTFAELFASSAIDPAPEAPSIIGRRTYTFAGKGLPFSTDYYDYQVHSAELIHKGMIPLVMTIKSREVLPRKDWSTHDGEEFIYVVSGVTELHTAYYAPLKLSAGDSAYIDSTMAHCFVSIGDEDASILSICMTEQLMFNDVSVGNAR